MMTRLMLYKKYRWWLLVLLLIVIVLFWQHYHNKPKAIAPVLVQTSPVKLQDVKHIFKTIGNVESPESVTLMSQITGNLSKIDITPGAHVKANQPLFEIESTIAQAVLQQAQATLARDQAQLDYLNADAKRYAALVKLEYVTRDQYDQTQAAATAQAALVAADKAQVKQAQITIEHSLISSPIDGKIGNFTVRMGDLIVENSTVLATINQLNPIWVSFSVPQNRLQNLQIAQKAQPLIVQIYTEDGKTKLADANLFFIDNTVNNATGTVALKAKTDNANYSLWPGESVRVNIILGVTKNALVIPLSALQFDEEGGFVYVLKKDQAMVQRVTVAQQTHTVAVITQGLNLNDIVLTTIPPNMENGMYVKVDHPETQP